MGEDIIPMIIGMVCITVWAMTTPNAHHRDRNSNSAPPRHKCRDSHSRRKNDTSERPTNRRVNARYQSYRPSMRCMHHHNAIAKAYLDMTNCQVLKNYGKLVAGPPVRPVLPVPLFVLLRLAFEFRCTSGESRGVEGRQNTAIKIYILINIRHLLRIRIKQL